MRVKLHGHEAYIATTSLGEIPLREFLKAAREHQGLSKSQLQNLAGLNHPEVSTYENGRVKSMRTMIMALDALGYNIYVVKREKRAP